MSQAVRRHLTPEQDAGLLQTQLTGRKVPPLAQTALSSTSITFGRWAETCCPQWHPPAPGLIKQPELILPNYTLETGLSIPAAPKALCHGSKMNHEKGRGGGEGGKFKKPPSSQGGDRAVPQVSLELGSDGNSLPAPLSC